MGLFGRRPYDNLTLYQPNVTVIPPSGGGKPPDDPYREALCKLLASSEFARGAGQQLASLGPNQSFSVQVATGPDGVGFRITRESHPAMVAPMQDVSHQVRQEVQRLLANPNPTYAASYQDAPRLPAVVEGGDVFIINQEGHKVFAGKLK